MVEVRRSDSACEFGVMIIIVVVVVVIVFYCCAITIHMMFVHY